MTLSFEEVLRLWPWPANSRIPEVTPFRLSLDAGGRQLLQTIFDTRPTATIAEFGSFLGGAPRKWLEDNSRLKCICVDPWGSDIVTYVRRLASVDWAVKKFGADLLNQTADLLEKYGPINIVRNNLFEFRNRCALFQARIPDAYSQMISLGVEPDIVFIDALKHREDYIKAHEKFPNAIITGDDWSWAKQEDGTYPIRPFVQEVAAARGATIYAAGATFVVAEPRHGLSFEEKFRYAA